MTQIDLAHLQKSLAKHIEQTELNNSELKEELKDIKDIIESLSLQLKKIVKT